MTNLHPAVPAWLGSAPDSAQRRFLFLQGPIGTFFDKLAIRLQKRGHQVHRVHFNGGDRQFCSGGSFSEFRDGAEQWPAFFKTLLSNQRITDVVLFGDCRPLHRTAIGIAELRGIPVHVFEEGYLRPNWLTLEIGGVNRHSPLSRDPKWFVEQAKTLAPWDPGIDVRGSFARRAAEDVIYRICSLIRGRRYPRYQTHKPWNPLTEYRCGAQRFFFIPLAKRHNRKVTRELIKNKDKFFLFPLQLEADAQIRFHSPLKSMVPAIHSIIDSFAKHAPADHRLVVTEHPLDTGVVNLRKVTLERAIKSGVRDRVTFLHCGSPEPLLRASQGMVTVNSTIGIPALDFGLPVKTIGHAVYDIDQLTFQGPLDDFWTHTTPPNRELFECFRQVVAARSQINGGLYSFDSIALAVENACARLSAPVEMMNFDDAPLDLPSPILLTGRQAVPSLTN